MIYKKFPVVLLSAAASERNDTTNRLIAEYIIAHASVVKDMGIKELAQECHVGMASISRFCRDIGLQDFTELKDILSIEDFHYEQTKNIDSFTNQLTHSIEITKETVDADAIQRLCNDLNSYEHISAYGMLKAQSAAVCFQTDMLMCGKFVHTATAYADQINHLCHASKDELILIFSYTGAYFDYPDIRAYKKQLEKPKLWMISGSNQSFPSFVDDVITFQSDHSQFSHPYTLQYVANLITQTYTSKQKEEVD